MDTRYSDRDVLMPKTPIRLYCQLAIYIIQNRVFLERIKCNGVDCHVVRGKYAAGIIEPKHLSFTNQLVDLLTKPFLDDLGRSKLGMYDVYAPICGELYKLVCEGILCRSPYMLY